MDKDNHDQQDQWQCGAILCGDISRRQIIENTDQQSTDERTADLVETTNNGRNEGDKAKCFTIGEFCEIDGTDQIGRKSRQSSIDQECIEDHALDIDAENFRNSRILRCCLHAAPRAGAIEKQRQQHNDTERQRQVENVTQ